MLVEHWPWQKRPDHWPAVGRHDTEAVEAEGAEAEAIAIPVTKPCWPPRYMRRSPASAEYKDSIAPGDGDAGGTGRPYEGPPY